MINQNNNIGLHTPASGEIFVFTKVQRDSPTLLNPMKTTGIYKITSPTGKIYIGQSVDCKRRFRKYKSGHSEGQSKLHASFQKHGVESHIFEVIHECSHEELNGLEKHYIEFYKSFNTEHGLNLNSGGNVRLVSDETKSKISCLRKGMKFSFEHRQRIRESKMGHSYNKGSKRTEETKRKMSEAKLGSKFSESHKQNMSKAMKGRVFTEEWKMKLRKPKPRK